MPVVEKTERLLCIVGSMDVGGAETFLMKIYREMDRNKYQMDFYVTATNEGYYEEEIKNLGGRIYHSLPKTKSFLKSLNNLRKVVRDNKYKSVFRLSQHSLSTLDLLVAKIGGANNLIFRSSSTSTNRGKASDVLHIMFRWLARIIPTVKVAPSKEAAIFMFGEKYVNKGKVNIVNNAIDVNKFCFDNSKRNFIRRQLGINDEFVIGHVGRFSKVKNHEFLLNIFCEVIKDCPKSILLLVGDGELRQYIENRVQILGVSDKVIFTGIRQDVSDLMMSMDAFVFPSFYEGMPNTVIEAQATGLKCFVSKSITNQVNITGRVEFLSLKNDADFWSHHVLDACGEYVREEAIQKVVDGGYDINSTVKKLKRLFFQTSKI